MFMLYNTHSIHDYYTQRQQILTAELQSEHVTTRVASLNWINMLHEKGDLPPCYIYSI